MSYKAYFVEDRTRVGASGQRREGLEEFLNSLPPEEVLVLITRENATSGTHIVFYTVVTEVEDSEAEL